MSRKEKHFHLMYLRLLPTQKLGNDFETLRESTWTITPELNKNLEAAEWFLRRILKISNRDRVANDTVLKRPNTKRTVIATVNERTLKFLGHCIRKEEYECLILQGRLPGKRSRGRKE